MLSKIPLWSMVTELSSNRAPSFFLFSVLIVLNLNDSNLGIYSKVYLFKFIAIVYKLEHCYNPANISTSVFQRCTMLIQPKRYKSRMSDADVETTSK